MTPFQPRRRARLLHVSGDVHAFFDAWQKWAHEQGKPWAPLSSFTDGAVRKTDAYRHWKATGMVPGQEAGRGGGVMAEQPNTYGCKLKNRRISVTRVNADTYGMEFVRLQNDDSLMAYDGEPNRHVSIRRGVVTTRFTLSRDAFLALLTAGVEVLKDEQRMEANNG